MMQIASEADVTEPRVDLRYVAWPDAREGDSVHYALLAIGLNASLIFNPVSAPGFPQYNGDFDRAPGMLTQMKVVNEVV